MNFARNQLEKYGWTVGKGLGPREDGIAVPLKPTLKKSKTGLGHDLANEHTDHWWTLLYDKAAHNVVVKSGEAGEDISTKEDNSFNIASETWKITHNQQIGSNKGKYANHFVKKAVLTNNRIEGVTDSESSSDDDVPTKDVFKMTDEELFAACGGRTAHKAAKHGIRANGKLSRIKEQEEQLLAHPKFEGYSHAKLMQTSYTLHDVKIKKSTTTGNEENEIKRKKKKKRKLIPELGEVETPNERNGDDFALVSKKNKEKIKCSAESNEAELFDPVDSKLDVSVRNNKKKKLKCNSELIEPEELNLVDGNETSSMVKNRKKKKKCHAESEKVETLLTADNGVENVMKIIKIVSPSDLHEVETINPTNDYENTCLTKMKNDKSRSNSYLYKAETPNALECGESIAMTRKKTKKKKHNFEIHNTISESVSVSLNDNSNKRNKKTFEDSEPDIYVENKQTPEDAAVTAKKEKKKKRNGNK